MVVLIPTIIWGAVGGFARVLISLQKAIFAKEKIVWWKFLITLFEGGLFGGIFGYFLQDYNPFLAFFVGIASSYLLENVYKIIRFATIKVPITET